jgi:CubicO group peptidase (beta-lactamase class C family)
VVTESLGVALAAIDEWGATNAAAAVVGPNGTIVAHGAVDHRFRWASITKIVTALATLVAAERGDLSLDEPAGPPGSTVRHLLAHASGLPFEGTTPITPPGSRRIYSNPGYDALGSLVADRTRRPFDEVLERDVLGPLGMSGAALVSRPSEGLHGRLVDLVALARELLRPTLLSTPTAEAMRSVAFPGLVGVLPGVGRFDPLDWGLGPELRGDKRPHWTGRRNSPRTFGHFGGAGTFVWVDPALDVGLVCLTDRGFQAWALQAWPRLSDSVIDAIDPGRGAPGP